MQLYLFYTGISNISMQQQKRLNIVQQSRAAEFKEIKIPTRKHNKVKQIKSKIFKNISQLPIQIYLDSKENLPSNQPQRPHSSLFHQQHHLKPYRVESALSQYPDHKQGNNRKRLSLDSTGKKYERDSLVSKNSMSKKVSRNTKSIEESLKLKFTEERRKSNVSCRSIHEEAKMTKKQSLKLKRPSASSLHQGGFTKQKQKENRQPKQPKMAQKSRSKSKKVKRKSTVQLDKSKASTTVIGNFEKGNIKKKQSNSTAYIGITSLPKKKKKVAKKKSEIAIDLSSAVEQPSMEEYPISKYDIWAKAKVEPKRLSSKRRSKSGKGSASKEHKKGVTILQMDYVSCINIPSNSSGLIQSKLSNSSSQKNSKIKILDNWQYHYLGEQHTQSVNFQEIRYYQSQNCSHKKEQADFIKKNFKDKTKYYYRRFIEQEIAEDYPHFQEVELKFLASVIFIQRKWRENRLYRQIFQQIANSPHKISQISLEKSNSKQLHISNHNKSTEKQPASKNQNQDNFALQSIQQSQSSQYIQKMPQEYKQNEQHMRNTIYLNQNQPQEKPDREYLFDVMKEEQHGFQDQLRSNENNLTTRSDKYQFLGNELFPSMAYVRVKQQQLKQELYQKICQFSELQRSGTIDGKEFQKLRTICQEKYKRELSVLDKSRKDIKKGYLSIIDSCKNIRQADGLRRVSSDHGPMAMLYMRIFNLEASLKTPSQSSESMKRLTKRVLIRKQFFQSHKIQPNIINATLQSTLSARQINKIEQQNILSARVFKRKEFQSETELNEINQIQQLQIKRIREGFILSPQIKMRPAEASPLKKHSQKIPNALEDHQSLIFHEIIATLTHQLFCQLMKIDEKRENVVDILQEGQESHLTRIKGSQIKDFQIVEESSSLDFEEEVNQEDFEIVQDSKIRQIYKIEGLSEKAQPVKGRKHRKSNTYNISPATLEPIKFEEDEIMTYGRQLFEFLKQIRIEDELVSKLNKNQGFSPIQYLRFLRDFQIPDEEYEPLISNQIFMQWQEYYDNKSSPHQQQGFIIRQASAVFHRCIFECLIGFLQQFRPSGEKGEPFPWQNVFQFKRPLSIANIKGLYTQSLAKLEHTIKLKCGIVEQKQLIFNQPEMERVQQQNQDKIIFMLQEELSLSPHNWYEIEQHCLEVKLEIESELLEYILLQALDQLLGLL